MTEFSIPPLAIDYDGRWIGVDLHGDLHEWAERVAADVTKRWGGRKQPRLVPLLEGAGQLARNAGDASIALLLYPVPNEGIRAIVRFCPIDLGGLEGDKAWSALMAELVPDEPWEEPAEVTEIATKAGPSRRIVRRWVAGEGNTRGIGEQLAYAWVFSQYGAGVIMTTSFINLAEAGRWRPVLDELAAAAELKQAYDHRDDVMTAGAESSVLEIRPVRPDGQLSPGDNAVLQKWLLRADPTAGTLEFTEDRAFVITPSRHLSFHLPSTGRADAVRTVCTATYRWIRDLQTGIGWRLLFLDSDGRVIGQGRRRDDPRASQLWPLRIFEPLRALGIDVAEQSFNTEKQFKSAFPGV